MFVSAIVTLVSFLGIEGSIAALGAGIAALSCIGAGLGMGISTGKAVEGIARQPEAHKQIRSTLFIGLAFCETTAIYGLFIAIMLVIM
ncbi:MAG: ATP synthase F0 subunit C [Roseburia sp.]|nr:ATP synthase F0 subunit C [Roseburia sp.]